MLKVIKVFILLCLYKDLVLSINTNPKLPEKVFYQLEDVNDLFNDFIVKYEKKYSSEEYAYRHKVFVENLAKINRFNREQPDAVFEINPFTDMTFEEFVKTHTGFVGNYTNENAIKYEPNGMAPDSLDWRQNNLVTRVKSQGSCGSCYIFSAIGNIEGQHAKKHGQLISLSEQQSLDCNSNGCNGGHASTVMQEESRTIVRISVDDVVLEQVDKIVYLRCAFSRDGRALVKTGCMKESDYPYEGKQGQCRFDQSKVVVKVTGGSDLSIKSEDDLKDAVATYGPLSVSMFVNEELKKSGTGIFTPRAPCNSGGHAVLLIGYGSEGGVPYWLIKNSWGPNWADGGFFRLVRGKGACSFGKYVASATVA